TIFSMTDGWSSSDGTQKKIIDFDAFEFGTGPVDGPNFSKGDSYYLATPLQKSITDWWDAKITPSYSHEKLFTFDPSFENSHITNRTYTIDVQNNLDLGEYFSATFGGEYQVLNGVNNESDLRKTIYEQGYYLQTQFNHEDRIILTAGFRQDINSKFEDKLTYKFEGAYRFKEYGTRLRAAAATGFRAPTLNDLFFPGFSNPNLKPEESESWEVGFDQKFFDDRVEIGTTYFDSDLTNLIQFDFATSMPENVGKATSQGLENYLKVAVTKSLDVSLNYTWNQAEDDDGVPLRRRAKHKFTATAYHTWNKLNSLVSVIYKSDIRDGVGVGADGFTRVRAALSYRVLDNLTVTARGENLFDEDYEEIPGFGTADVSGYAGFVFTF
ncbi:MAG: TonB-dependent receptor plug domain-containing protein, partial [Nitrospinales bacterium]